MTTATALAAVSPGLTEHDLKIRQDYLNASDIPAILGTSPYANIHDVWFGLTHALEPMKPNLAMTWGHLLEDPIRQWTEIALREQLNDMAITVDRLGTRRVHRNGIMRCTLDAIARIDGKNEGVEIKTRNILGYAARIDSQWGTPVSDEVPPHILDQVLAQMACAPDIERVWIPLVTGFREPCLYVVEAEHHLARIAEIENRCCDFWDQHVLTGIPPRVEGGISPETAARDQTPRQTLVGVNLPDELLEQFDTVKTQIKELEDRKGELDGEIMGLLSGAMRGHTPKGHAVRLSSVTRKAGLTKASTFIRKVVTIAGAPI